MASVLPGFEYDIFISYRHNDNQSGWVTEFVRVLREELAAAIKDPVSIYFDYNLHDGLLETHNVDKSLAEKLNCIVFVPIISQTYCDPKSFAWKNEFCAFNKLAQASPLGRDIKLKNGNVASRILPIQIHELDSDDKGLLTNELGGPLRSVEFIYQTRGVVRPLLHNEEDPKGNLNHAFYRDQMNKVVRVIKELISEMQIPTTPVDPPKKAHYENVPRSIRKKLSLLAGSLIAIGLITFSLFYFAGFGNKIFQEQDKSIAVLPFENMNNDPAQDYFSNGIAEDVLDHLTKIADLKVKSRTSTLQYKGTVKTVSQIGEELGVGSVVEGSVRHVGDKVRIVVQLIDARSDVHLWSETYDRDFKDVLALQSEIAVEIAKALEAKLTSAERQNISREISQDVTAYDYFLKAREIVNGDGSKNKTDLNNSLRLVDHAIELDSNFSQAIALKGKIWSLKRRTGISEKVWTDSAIYYSSKAIEVDPSNPSGYLVKAEVLRYVGELKQSAALSRKAYELAPNNAEVQNNYGYLLLRDRNEKGADLVIRSIEGQYQIVDPRYYSELSFVLFLMNDLKGAEELLLKALSLDPGSEEIIYMLSFIYRDTQEYTKAIAVLNQSNVKSVQIIDAIAEMCTMKKDYSSAIQYYEQYKEIEKGFEDTTQSVPLRHRLAFAYSKIGRKKEGDKLMQEQLQILDEMIARKRSIGTWVGGFGSIYYDRALCLAYFGNKQEAVKSLDSAFHYGWTVDWYYHNDPLLANLQADDAFHGFLKKEDAFRDFRKEAFTNAFARAKARKELKGLLGK